MYKPLPSYLPNEVRARTRAIIEHQATWEMPIALRATSLLHNRITYSEKQIRTFAKILAPSACSYLVNSTDRRRPSYRELWEQTAAIDDDWLRFRRLFGDAETEKMIDKAVEQQTLRERGEVE